MFLMRVKDNKLLHVIAIFSVLFDRQKVDREQGKRAALCTTGPGLNKTPVCLSLVVYLVNQ